MLTENASNIDVSVAEKSAPAEATPSAAAIGGRGDDARPDDARPSALVVGAGFGGLAAAIRLIAKGYKVTVLEALDAPGGRAYVHKVGGYSFDAGPTIITAPFLLEELWALLGERLSDHVTLKQMDPFYRLRFDDGSELDCSGDAEAMRREVARVAPEDRAGYERFMVESEAMYRAGFEGMAHKPFSTLWHMIPMLPDLIRLRADRSVHRAVSRFISNEKLRIALSFHPLFVGGDPFRVTAFYTMISYLERRDGVLFAMGGTGAVVREMVSLIERHGGEVRCDAPVAEIETAQGRRRGRRAVRGVRLRDGTRLAADIVVSNVDSAITYREMLPSVRRRRWTNAKLDRADYSMSLFVWYFGTKKVYDDVKHHTVVLGPRYKDLLKDIFKRKTLAEDFSLYLHRPTATDPSLAPAGCDAFYALSPVPHLDSGTDWPAQAEGYRQRVQDRLEETVLPGLGAALDASIVATPLDFRDRLNSFKGAAFGLEPTLLQSAWFRPPNRSEEAEGLYLVGAGTHPGAGVPGVLSSARVIDGLIPAPVRAGAA